MKLSERQLRVILNDVQAIQANLPTSDAMGERLLGVEQALLMILEKKNYVELWIRNEAKARSKTHNPGCGCGVCGVVKRYQI
jgi:hypothetical protein